MYSVRTGATSDGQMIRSVTGPRIARMDSMNRKKSVGSKLLLSLVLTARMESTVELAFTCRGMDTTSSSRRTTDG